MTAERKGEGVDAGFDEYRKWRDHNLAAGPGQVWRAAWEQATERAARVAEGSLEKMLPGYAKDIAARIRGSK